MTLDGLDACVRRLRSDMIDFTAELVAIASENPPGAAYEECVRAIQSRLRALDLPCDTIKYRPRAGVRDQSGAAIVLSRVGKGRRALYFSGHYDVVPVTTPGQCKPVLKDNMLFGRGSADMKSGLASMLYAAAALKRLRVPLNGHVALVFVPDEETGGQRGSGFLAAAGRLGVNGIGMLTPEPTSGVVWNANRGALTVRVTVHGREAHIGLLHQGRNAFFAVFDEARQAGVKLDVEVLQEGHPSGTSEATALGRALSSHVREVTGKTPKFELCPGLLEIRFYAERGIPAYAYGPGLLSISHGPKEFVDTDRIVECAMIYARVAATVLGAQ